MNFFLQKNELIIYENIIFDLKKNFVQFVVFDIVLNYIMINRSNQKKFIISIEQMFVRRIFNFQKRMLRFLINFNFMRTKLKIQKFIKQHFVNKFDIFHTNHFVIFLFLFMFINEFDFYRNMYRTLMKFYVNIISFNFRKRTRRINVLFLILNSHDNNFNDVVHALQKFYQLNADKIIQINEIFILICVFIMTFLNDMSQQQKNFEFLFQKINFECRFCFIHVNFRENLNFDFIEYDRYHFDTFKMRNEQRNIFTQKKKNKYDIMIDIDSNDFSFFSIFSFFDIIITRSNDSAHSKYNDITKKFHQLLMNVILISNVQKLYIVKFRRFFFFSN